MRPSFLLTSALALTLGTATLADTPTPQSVLQTYATIGEANFQDSLITAKALQAAVGALITTPSAETLQAAKDAWLRARNPYQQTEVFRFANPIVDDWEGKVNAWPLDEGLIDYVDSAYGLSDENDYAALNVVATPVFTLSGTEVDAIDITPELLQNTLHEADGIDSNVATGYHAIEFLLWGQDLNGHDAGAGNRPWIDFAKGDACTNGNCDRRAAYLKAATDLLVSDLEYMVAQWAEGGEARANVLADETAGLSAILTGMGSLSYGELAGERMRLGLMLNDPEEEHDCFSDNTHNSHYYDGMGIQNVYLGRYTRIDGSLVEGPALTDLVAADNAALDAEMTAKLASTMAALEALKEAGDTGFAYDQMLERGNVRGEALIMGGVNGLIDQTKSIERVIIALGLDQTQIEGSDSLDDPSAVFQ
ncbi:putative iron-regulated protein [Thalassovita gelatinovora]|uniref:Putative iron-regulated protein n=1 Tax=Thalassovita gelatinovora TaxID=53501 RepID=A0A0P1FKZ4_THAGE|nr:imelysin family protein [Thalassovita gelatinovora]QIZ82371.1 peptidase [Thalassovita gelatinovora]CUH68440.1 putative iron-regulated protein [Thalassovita gelatinovora]SEQ52211.1 putative iron-regulated protein [Thalassovita gelatinovora]